MKSGSLPFCEFERIVQDAAFDHLGGVRTFLCAGGAADAPPDTATMVFGAWDNGDWYNVTRPDIPERDIYRMAEESGRAYRRLERYGWKTLIIDMIASGHVRVTPDVRSMLEQHELDRAMKGGGWRFTA